MAEVNQSPNQSPYPVRPGAIPTADGVFPVELSAGGRRRRRRPHFDLGQLDAKVANVGLKDLLELAWGIIANAHGGNWDDAAPEWREAAEKWRERYFADGKVIAFPPAPTANLQADQPPAPAFDVEAWVGGCSTLDAFLEGLAGFEDDRAAEILAPHWNRDEDTFLDAATAKWNEYQAGKLPQDPDVTTAADRSEEVAAAFVANAPKLDPEEEEETRDDPFTPEVHPRLLDSPAQLPEGNPEGVTTNDVELKNVAGETIDGKTEVAGPSPATGEPEPKLEPEAPKVDTTANTVPPPPAAPEVPGPFVPDPPKSGSKPPKPPKK